MFNSVKQTKDRCGRGSAINNLAVIGGEVGRILATTQQTWDAQKIALDAAAREDTSEGAKKAIRCVEDRLHKAYADAQAKVENLFEERIDHMKQAFGRMLDSMDTGKLDAVLRDTEVDTARLKAAATPRLVEARRDERRQARELGAFRIRHGLQREASYPESLALHYAIVSVIWLVEALANTWAFAQGSRLGMVGGLFQAMLVAGLNVGIAFYAGRLATGLFHRCWNIRLGSLAVVALWLAFEGAYALMAAHYRIALAQTADDASRLAVDRLLTMPWAIDDVLSLLLLVVTVIFGIGALTAGLSSDDRYPGYGHISRVYARAAKRWAQARERFLGELDQLFRQAKGKLDEVVTNARTLQGDLRSAETLAKDMEPRMQQALKEIASAHRQAVTTARQAFQGVWPVFDNLAAEPVTDLPESESLRRLRDMIDEFKQQRQELPENMETLLQRRDEVETELGRRHTEAMREVPPYFRFCEALAESERARDEIGMDPRTAREAPAGTEEEEDKAASRDTVEKEPVVGEYPDYAARSPAKNQGSLVPVT